MNYCNNTLLETNLMLVGLACLKKVDLSICRSVPLFLKEVTGSRLKRIPAEGIRFDLFYSILSILSYPIHTILSYPSNPILFGEGGGGVIHVLYRQTDRQEGRKEDKRSLLSSCLGASLNHGTLL